MTRPTDSPDLLTAAEVAERLRISQRQVYRLAQKGEIPGVVRFGRLVRFRRDEVERLFGAVPPDPEAVQALARTLARQAARTFIDSVAEVLAAGSEEPAGTPSR